jgi:serine/threonine-protein kinase HipA
MSDIEVRLGTQHVGTIHRYAAAGGERIAFRYTAEWLSSEQCFPIDPELFLDARTTSPARGGLFGAFADSAPDRWGRRLMQRRERYLAEAAGRSVRSLTELDYLLGVSDRARQGALRFTVDGRYQAESDEVPPLLKLGALVDAADRIARDEDTSEDVALLLAPGSSLGGARPKASVLDTGGALAIAKFPRQDDEYSVERWEWVALELARRAGIQVPNARLVQVGHRDVLVSRRFDRVDSERVHFASALTLLGLRDGDQASYPEIAEILQREGSRPRQDSEEVFRRMVFNICAANLDDHLRNHGFLREASGWTLSPAYDLNPVPAEQRPRVLTTSITLEDFTGSLEVARDSADYFGLGPAQVERVISEVSSAVGHWVKVARAAGASRAECERMRSAFLT